MIILTILALVLLVVALLWAIGRSADRQPALTLPGAPVAQPNFFVQVAKAVVTCIMLFVLGIVFLVDFCMTGGRKPKR